MESPRLVSLNETSRLTSLSRTQINRLRSEGRFPAAVPLGERRVAFVAGEIHDWIRERIEDRARASVGA